MTQKYKDSFSLDTGLEALQLVFSSDAGGACARRRRPLFSLLKLLFSSLVHFLLRFVTSRPVFKFEMLTPLIPRRSSSLQTAAERFDTPELEVAVTVCFAFSPFKATILLHKYQISIAPQPWSPLASTPRPDLASVQQRDLSFSSISNNGPSAATTSFNGFSEMVLTTESDERFSAVVRVSPRCLDHHSSSRAPTSFWACNLILPLGLNPYISPLWSKSIFLHPTNEIHIACWLIHAGLLDLGFCPVLLAKASIIHQVRCSSGAPPISPRVICTTIASQSPLPGHPTFRPPPWYLTFTFNFYLGVRGSRGMVIIFFIYFRRQSSSARFLLPWRLILGSPTWHLTVTPQFDHCSRVRGSRRLFSGSFQILRRQSSSVQLLRPPPTVLQARFQTYLFRCFNVDSSFDYSMLFRAFAFGLWVKLLHEFLHAAEQASPLTATICFSIVLFFFQHLAVEHTSGCIHLRLLGL